MCAGLLPKTLPRPPSAATQRLPKVVRPATVQAVHALGLPPGTATPSAVVAYLSQQADRVFSFEPTDKQRANPVFQPSVTQAQLEELYSACKGWKWSFQNRVSACSGAAVTAANAPDGAGSSAAGTAGGSGEGDEGADVESGGGEGGAFGIGAAEAAIAKINSFSTLFRLANYNRK